MNGGVLLFAEDNDDDAFLFQRALLKSGCGLRMVRVKDGAEVFEYWENQGNFADKLHYPKPDIIVSDLNMPREGGLVVLNWLKEHDFLRRTTFILLTSSEKASEMERAMLDGAHAYVIKTMNGDQMAEWLRETVAAVVARQFDEHGWLQCPHNAYRASAVLRMQ